MTVHLTVAWTVTAGGVPRPWLHCRACGTARPFSFSGKARLNSNGRRFDGWLVYRCAVCEATWNRPVLERRRAEEVAPDLLDALRLNLSGPLLKIAGDREGLMRHARRIEEERGVDLSARVLSSITAAAPGLTLRLRPEGPVGARLDRILAQGLGVSRARIGRLAGEGRLAVAPDGALSRPLRGTAEVGLALGGVVDAGAILRAASRT